MTDHPRDHLEHLPGRTFLIVLAAISGTVVIAAVSQLVSSEQTDDSVLWSIVIAVGVLTLLALGVAWEERRAHVHALVRQATEHDVPAGGPDPMAELLRMGAHREVDYLRARETSDSMERP
jgi:hypothetical protein